MNNIFKLLCEDFRSTLEQSDAMDWNIAILKQILELCEKLKGEFTSEDAEMKHMESIVEEIQKAIMLLSDDIYKLPVIQIMKFWCEKVTGKTIEKTPTTNNSKNTKIILN